MDNLNEPQHTDNSCWPWSHQWKKWDDLKATEVCRVSEPTKPVGIAIKQERRCTVCNQVQLRTEKTTL